MAKPGVVPDHREPLVTECVHQRGQVVGLRTGVVAVLWLVREPHAALIDRDHLEVAGQHRHQQTPRVPRLRPAVHQQQRRSVTADDRVQPHPARVDVPARERRGELCWEVRRGRHGAGTLRGGKGGGG